MLCSCDHHGFEVRVRAHCCDNRGHLDGFGSGADDKADAMKVAGAGHAGRNVEERRRGIAAAEETATRQTKSRASGHWLGERCHDPGRSRDWRLVQPGAGQ